MAPAPARPRRQDLWMPCCDGARLATRLWQPQGEGPWPVLLMRQPYGRAIASTVTYAHPRWYAAQGFLVVVQDVRGRGDSDGTFAGFAQEAADSAAAVRWCRSLQDANGLVGTYGFSYQGLSQLLNAGGEAFPGRDPDPATAPDPLPDCLAPAMCGIDERLHWASEGGAHWWSLGLAWALQLAAEGCRRRSDGQGWQRIRRSLAGHQWLEDGLELLQELDPGGMGLGWLQQDPAEASGWRRHQPLDGLLRRPMLLIGGWHDPHLTGVLDLFARSRAAGGQPRLCVGAWSHLDWNGGLDRLQLAFFQQHLSSVPSQQGHPDRTGGAGESRRIHRHPAGHPPWLAQRLPQASPFRTSAETETPLEPDSLPDLPAEDGMRLQCSRSGRWWADSDGDPRALQGWQLASAGLAAIRSDEGQLLPLMDDRSGPPGDTGADHKAGGLTLVHDPWRPVPSRGGHLGPEPGLVERSDLDRRGDVACFQTAPLQTPLHLLGRPWLRIEAGADQPGFDLWAALSLVQADGRVLQLCTGVRRLLGPKAQQLHPLELAFQPVAATLEPGERLRLSLATAAWPAIAVNPGDGSMPRGGSGPGHRVISLDLELQAARLWLEPLIGAN